MGKIDKSSIRIQQYIREHEANGEAISAKEIAQSLEVSTSGVRGWLQRHHPGYKRTDRKDSPLMKQRRQAKEQRRKKVKSDFAQEGYVKDRLVATQEGVSPETIRRDRGVLGIPNVLEREREKNKLVLQSYLGGTKTVRQISEETKIPPTTVSRLLHELEEKRGTGGPGRRRGSTD